MRSQSALIHEILERDVSILLEFDVIIEALFDHHVDLGLERQQLSSELDGVFEEGLIGHYFISSSFYVGLHLLDYEFQCAFYSSEDPEHQSQLI